MEEIIIPIVAILSIFVFAPLIFFHYITLWRKQKTLLPDDERMMEDLWRSAKVMERRIETLEALLEDEPAEKSSRSETPRRSIRPID